MFAETWQYAVTHWEYLLQLVVQHLQIIAVGNGIGVAVGVTVGIIISDPGRSGLADVVLYLSQIMMTIPSMALFGLLMPVLAGLALPSIGYLPAIIALVAYGLLPILRNTYTGLRGVDPAMIEAGRGMGMSNRQILFRIKLPLAIPVIMAGLRNAVVLNIGIATVAVVIGAGGLGVPIFRGIRNFRPDLILSGAILVSLLAVAVDVLLGQIENRVTPKGIRLSREQQQ